MILVAVFLTVAILIAIFIFLFRALATKPAQEFSVEWLNAFSLESYAPMERLLDRSDLAFLASQPGYRPEIGKRLLAERRKIFRGYLRLLVRDFNQLIGLGKLMVVYAERDRGELANTLWRQQVRFYLVVCTVQCKLALYPFGWPAVNVQPLLEALAAMRQQIQLLTPQLAAVGQGA